MSQKVFQVHRGLAYGDGLMSGAGLSGQLVKLSGADTFAVNSGSGAPDTKSFGILAVDCADGGRPTIFCQKGIYETSLYAGDNLSPGDGLYCNSDGKLCGGYDDALQAVKASKNIGATGKVINFQSQFGGTLGNLISVTMTGGTSKTLGVTVDGTDITIQLETDSEGAVQSTCAEVVAAVNADADASALVRAATANGTGVPAAVTKTELADGANAAQLVGHLISIVDGVMKFSLDI